jgi:glycerol-3-phosphate acyltransferase PlsY
MQISIIIMCVIGGYLFGSISIPRLMTRIVAPGQELEHIELKNFSEGGTFDQKTVGATTSSMVLGTKIGGLIGLLDILKGAIPTLAIRLLFPNHPYFLFIVAAIVVGHIWPIYHSFRGGGREAFACIRDIYCARSIRNTDIGFPGIPYRDVNFEGVKSCSVRGQYCLFFRLKLDLEIG